MAFPAFLDANVLIPIHLTDLLLRLADDETYRPLWSAQVLNEVERNLPKVGVEPQKAARRVDVMRGAFPDAEVTGYEALIPRMTNHPKDRHVLAAAVRGDAEIIVTANVSDFPAVSRTAYNIGVRHPDDFLLDQLDLYPEKTIACLGHLIEDLRKPPMSTHDFLGRFRRTVPKFTDEVGTWLLT
jgi:predicted nucleic acid-binding protein